MYRVAQRLCGAQANAEDLVARTLLQCSKAWLRFDGRNPRAWMLRILRNEHLQELRGRSALSEALGIEENAEYPHTPVSAQAMLNIAIELISKEIEKLPIGFREVIVLCDVEELPYKEAASILEVPMGTLCSRLHRARHMLRNALAASVPVDTGAR